MSAEQGGIMDWKKIWQNYNLGIVLVLLFFMSWVLHAAFQWFEYVQNAETHHEAATLAAYIPEFLASTFENWQSEFLQLFTMVVLTSVLNYKGSPESRDAEVSTERNFAEIEKKLDELSARIKA
jgi:hypothetical protein